MSNRADICRISPRLIRLRDAPYYLGMDRNRFNAEVRPCLIEIPIGKQGVAFDRLDLDAWTDQYKSRNGRPASNPIGERVWDAKERLGSGFAGASGISTKSSKDGDLVKLLEQATLMKRNAT